MHEIDRTKAMELLKAYEVVIADLKTQEDTEDDIHTLIQYRTNLCEAIVEDLGEDTFNELLELTYVTVPGSVVVDASNLALEVIDPTPGVDVRELAERVSEATSEWTEDE